MVLGCLRIDQNVTRENRSARPRPQNTHYKLAFNFILDTFYVFDYFFFFFLYFMFYIFFILIFVTSRWFEIGFCSHVALFMVFFMLLFRVSKLSSWYLNCGELNEDYEYVDDLCSSVVWFRVRINFLYWLFDINSKSISFLFFFIVSNFNEADRIDGWQIKLFKRAVHSHCRTHREFDVSCVVYITICFYPVGLYPRSNSFQGRFTTQYCDIDWFCLHASANFFVNSIMIKFIIVQ